MTARFDGFPGTLSIRCNQFALRWFNSCPSLSRRASHALMQSRVHTPRRDLNSFSRVSALMVALLRRILDVVAEPRPMPGDAKVHSRVGVRVTRHAAGLAAYDAVENRLAGQRQRPSPRQRHHHTLLLSRSADIRREKISQGFARLISDERGDGLEASFAPETTSSKLNEINRKYSKSRTWSR
jgi:hypothetical protein